MTRAGDYDRFITIERRSTSVNDVGDTVETWAAIAGVWAARDPQQAVERFGANETYATVDTVFRTRWYPWAPTLTPQGFRIVYRDRIYNVLGFAEIGRREQVQIPCVARGDLEGAT